MGDHVKEIIIVKIILLYRGYALNPTNCNI